MYIHIYNTRTRWIEDVYIREYLQLQWICPLPRFKPLTCASERERREREDLLVNNHLQ